MPDHYLRTSPDSKRTAKLVRETGKVDYVFAIEYRWKETLTDAVSVNDLLKARQSLARAGIGTVIGVLKQVFGDRYDWRDLERWAHTEGSRWFFEMVDVYLDAGIRQRTNEKLREDFAEATDIMTISSRRLDADNRLLLPLAQTTKRHGLNLFDSDGTQLQNGRRALRAVQAFVRQKLKQHVRTKAGKPITDESTDEILNVLSYLTERVTSTLLIFRLIGDGYDKELLSDLEKERETNKHTNKRIESAIEAVLTKRFGGADAGYRQLVTLWTRIVGLHWGVNRRFDYIHQMPGIIIDSNGTSLSDSKVKWEFSASAAYPTGYEMRCRSLQARKKVQRKLLKAVPIKSRDQLIRFTNLLKQSDYLSDVLEKCKTQGSMKPLKKAYQNELAESQKTHEETSTLRQLKRLVELLNLWQ